MFRFLRPSLSKAENISMGSGKMMVEFFSAEIEFRVCKVLSVLELQTNLLQFHRSPLIGPFSVISIAMCIYDKIGGDKSPAVLTWRYLSCSAAGDIAIMSAASFSALLDFCSPSAAITCTVASLASLASLLASSASSSPWPAPHGWPLPRRPWRAAAAGAASRP